MKSEIKLLFHVLYEVTNYVNIYFKKLSVKSFDCDWTGISGQPLTDENTWSCCSATKQCPVNKGDCDINDDCKDDLICGINNCQSLNPGEPFPSGADCCVVAPRKLHIFCHTCHTWLMEFLYG
jgi:hypothetical protein